MLYDLLERNVREERRPYSYVYREWVIEQVTKDTELCLNDKYLVIKHIYQVLIDSANKGTLCPR